MHGFYTLIKKKNLHSTFVSNFLIVFYRTQTFSLFQFFLSSIC